MTILAVRPELNRTLAIAVGVVLFHGFVLWALQSGLLRRDVDLLVPVTVISEVIVQPRPVTPPPPIPAAQFPRTTTPVPRPAVARPTPAPQPAALVNPELTPIAPTAAPVTAGPTQVVPTPVSPMANAAPAEGRPSTPTAPRVELPSSDADYLHNPKPAYPALSKRMGEQGTAQVRVLIGTDGVAQQAEIQQSSSFDRLDQAALATVLRWRYVPGKRAGKPEAMWFTVPITFVLQ